MFFKQILILTVALVVAAQAAVINLQPIEGHSEYELWIGEAQLEEDSLPVHLRERRDTGSVSGDVSRGPGGTTTVTAEANRNIHTSRDGRTTVDAHGQYQRTYGNPHSRPNYNYGVRFKHRF